MRIQSAVLSLCFSFCALASPLADDPQFEPLLTKFLSGWNKHDAHLFAENFTMDAVISTVGGTRVQGREAIEKYLQPSFTGPTFKDSVYAATIKMSRLIGSDIAILDLDWEMTGALTRD